MKVRLSFVSNSSSSSFIVIGNEPQVLNCKVTKPVAKRVVDYVNRNGKKLDWDGKSSVYITREIRSEQVEFLEMGEYAHYDSPKSYPEFSVSIKKDEWGEEVFLRKEHLDSKILKSEFKRKVKELGKEFNIKYKLEIV